MKKLFLISITGMLIAASTLLSSFTVQADSPVELIDLRTRTSKTFDLGDGKYAVDVSINSIHYKDDPDDPEEQWKDINTAIAPSERPNWDYEVVRGNWQLLIKDDTTVALGKEGSWIGFRYEGFAYYDASTGEYEILRTRNSVTPTVDVNTIRWNNLFYGVNLEYIYTPDGFKENLEVTQAARTWCENHPPSSYGLNNQTTYIVGYLECDWQNAYPSEDKDGNSISLDDYEIEGQSIFWRHPIKDKIITALPLGYAIHGEVEPEDWVKLHHRFIKKNGTNYLLFGAKALDLNQYPPGTIIIDPTIDEQVGSSYDDAYEFGGGTFSNDNSYWRVNSHSDTGSDNFRCSGFRFQTVNVPNGATIDVAYIEPYVTSGLDDIRCHIYLNDVDDAADFNDEQDVIERGRTTDNVAWFEENLSDFAQSPSIVDPVQEVVNRGGWAANQDMVVLLIADTDYTYACSGYTYDQGSEYGAKLHIEYTAGGVSAPTVTTSAASSVEETTATSNGNITATGGENADYRGFEWDTDSGAPYTDNWTEGGSFGTGVFNHGITGLTKGELYYFRAIAHNSGGWGTGSELTFLTKPDPASSFASSDKGTTWISLGWTNGTGKDYVEIRYAEGGTAPTDNTSGTLGYWGSGTSANVTSLNPSTQYSFRIFTHASEGGLWSLSDNNPTCSDTTDTAISAPTVTTSAATNIESTTATLNGEVTATGGENPTVTVYWGDDDAGEVAESWDYSSAPTSPGQPQGAEAFYKNATGLPTGTTIYFNAKATNTGGTDWGTTQSFLTKPAAPTNVAASDGSSSDNVTITWTKSTGATDYQVYRDGNALGWAGDVATYTDTGADAPTITPGSTVATDGDSTDNVSLSLSGTSTNNGTTHTYKVRAKNATGESADSSTDTGYRGPGALTYQWQRSSADSDADYSNIDGATSSTYEDGAAPSPTITAGSAGATDGSYAAYVELTLSGESANNGDGRYFKCVLNADGCTQQTSASNRGYVGVGSLTFQWQRSAGDSDEDYSNIDGATTETYQDTGAPENGDGRYYKCVLNATGASSNTSANDRGYRAVLTAPSATTANATGVADTYATLNGSITDTGGENCDYRGWEWGLSSGNYSANWTASGSFGTGSYSHQVTSFSENTTYYFRAMAHNSEGWGYGSELQFTTEETPEACDPPSNFTYTQVGLHSANLTWTKGAGANTTVIRASLTEYPDSITDGYEIYNGTGEWVLLEDLDFDYEKVYLRAWSHCNPYSDDHASLTIGDGLLNETLTSVADQLENIGSVFQMGLAFVPLLAVSAVALWKENAVMFMITAGVAIMTGLYSPDIISGNYNTTALGISIGIALIAFSLLCCGWAFRLMFWERGEQA